MSRAQLKVLPAGLRAAVQVPATSANLGPGFDSMGLALALYDDVAIRTVSADEAAVIVRGEGFDTVPTDDSHLIVHLIKQTLAEHGYRVSGLELRANNRIPHARGLGSSAAATVAALALANTLLPEWERLDQTALLHKASALEGHPDNVAPVLSGGFTVAFDDAEGTLRSTRAPFSENIVPVVLVPEIQVSTHSAREALPATIGHKDAAANSAASALLTLALGGRTDLLMAGTEDRLHQRFRGKVMAPSLQVIGRLRERGHPAVVSGAGPSVLVFATGRSLSATLADIDEILAQEAATPDFPRWRVLELAIDSHGVRMGEHKPANEVLSL